MTFFTGYHKKSVFIRTVCVVDGSINPNSILAEDLNIIAQQHIRWGGIDLYRHYLLEVVFCEAYIKVALEVNPAGKLDPARMVLLALKTVLIA